MPTLRWTEDHLFSDYARSGQLVRSGQEIEVDADVVDAYLEHRSGGWVVVDDGDNPNEGGDPPDETDDEDADPVDDEDADEGAEDAADETAADDEDDAGDAIAEGDAEAFVDRTPMQDVIDDIEAGHVDDDLDRIEQAEIDHKDRVGVTDATEARRDEV